MPRFGRSFPMPRRIVDRPPVINHTGTGTLVANFSGSATPVITWGGTGVITATFGASATLTATVLPTPNTFPAGWHGLSQRFIDTVTNDQRWLAKIQVYTASGMLISDITQNVVSGSVTVDETAEVRRTCHLTLQGTPSMIPASSPSQFQLSAIGNMLHPANGNEIHISRGVQYSDGTSEFAQIGVFRPTKPTFEDDGQNIAITVSGNDRASVVARLAWQAPYTIQAGGNLSGAIQTALQFLVKQIYPNLTYNFTTDSNLASFTYPLTTFGASPQSTSDPMSDLITFAATGGAELFFDVFGNPTLRPIVIPTITALPVIDSLHFIEGVNCTMTQVGRTLDESTAFNGVILYCNGTGSAQPFVVKVWDQNPNSPTYFLGPWGQVPFIMTTTAIPSANDTPTVANSKATIMATRQLQLILGSFDTVHLSTIPNPAIREGDCLQISRARMNISAPYVVSQMTIPLDPETPMDITFRPKVQVLS